MGLDLALDGEMCAGIKLLFVAECHWLIFVSDGTDPSISGLV
jgi:hypothetical protein